MLNVRRSMQPTRGYSNEQDNCVRDVRDVKEHAYLLSFFIANFLEPKIQFGFTEIKTGSWTNSYTLEPLLGLVDHIDVARFAATAFQNPIAYNGRKIGIVSEELLVQDTKNQLAEAIGDSRSIKTNFVTDEEIAQAQAKGSPLAFSSEASIWHMQDYTDLDELHRLLPKLATFRGFLEPESGSDKEAYLS